MNGILPMSPWRFIISQGGHKSEKLGILGIFQNMENSGNFQGIPCNLRKNVTK